MSGINRIRAVIYIEGCPARIRRRLAIEIQTAFNTLGMVAVRVHRADDQESAEPENDVHRFAELEVMRRSKRGVEVWGIPRSRRRPTRKT